MLASLQIIDELIVISPIDPGSDQNRDQGIGSAKQMVLRGRDRPVDHDFPKILDVDIYGVEQEQFPPGLRSVTNGV